LKETLLPGIGQIFRLHQRFQHNSFLHYLIDGIFKSLFNKSYNETTGIKDIFAFRIQIITECDLINSLCLHSNEENKDYKFGSERLARKGHLAFNHQLAL
jgi:hypothetical protein